MRSNALLFLMLSAGVVGCGGSSNDDDSEIPLDEVDPMACVILTNEIQLSSGERCELTQQQADIYSLSSGLVVCDSGTLRFGGSELQSGSNGVQLNGLTFLCDE